jgi:hypothetical protein
MQTYNFDTFEWAKVLVGKNKTLDKLLKTAEKPFIIKVKRQQIVTVSAEKPPTGTYCYYATDCYLQGINATGISIAEEEEALGHRLFE